jgi:hypothetical protein
MMEPISAPAPVETPALSLEIQTTLDQWVVSGAADTGRAIMQYGDSGIAHVISRLERMTSLDADASLGWSAFHVLPLLGEPAATLIESISPPDGFPGEALAFAREWINFRVGRPPPEAQAAFVGQLEGLIAQAELRGEFVLTWTANQVPGAPQCRMQIYGNGYRVVTQTMAGEQPVEARSSLDVNQMNVVMESLRHGAVWLLRPTRDQGQPDEGKPTLAVRLGAAPGLDVSITLWNAEWRAGPSYYLVDLLDKLMAEGAQAPAHAGA